MCLTLVLSMVVVQTRAIAAPSLRVVANGDCPTRAQMQSSLSARGFGFNENGVVVIAEPDTQGLTVRLMQADGTLALERHFASQDCQALAQAVAVVLEAHFLEVNQPPDAVARETHSAAGFVGFAPAPTRVPLPPPPGPSSSGDRRRTHDSIVASGSVAFGAAFTIPEPGLSPLGEIAGGVDWARTGFSTQLVLFGSPPSTSGQAPDRVRRWNGWGMARMSFHGVLDGVVRPWVGLGLEFAQMRALDVAGAHAQSSLSAALGGGLTVVWPWSKVWAGQVDVNCLLLATRDAYVVEPDGQIGLGPRAVCSTLIGIGWGRY